MPKTLIAIISCHKFKDRADAQRKTWVEEMTSLVTEDKRFDIVFFLGRGATREPLPDEVFLDVEDDYAGLPYKVRGAMKWAEEHGYEHVLKCDDDTFVFPERIVHVIPTTPYVGRLNHTMPHIAPKGWCSGFAYWLSQPALGIIANAPTPTRTAEDLWVGEVLSSHGIECVHHPGFMVLSQGGPREWSQHRNYALAVCEFPGDKMIVIHKALRSADTTGAQFPSDVRPQFYRGLRNQPLAPTTHQFGRVIRKVK